jgi:hypothetical protein
MCLESFYKPFKSLTGWIDAFVSAVFHKLLVHDFINEYKHKSCGLVCFLQETF